MAMMGAKNESKVISGPGTVIGANVKLTGALRDVNDITIHGTVDGEVSSEKNVTVGETAQVKGPVGGANVSVAGTIRGSVDASNRLEILPTGKVFGNITIKDLVIRSGAIFVGKSTMNAEESREIATDDNEEETPSELEPASRPNYEVEE